MNGADSWWKEWVQNYVDLDGILLGLYLNRNPSESHIMQSGFEGLDAYFAANEFTKRYREMLNKVELHSVESTVRHLILKSGFEDTFDIFVSE